MKDINNPKSNDNRNYDYTAFPIENRSEYDYFIQTIPSGASVLDLGCGNGSLMLRLMHEKNARTTGVEIAESGVLICKAKGLNAVQGSIDQHLPFTDKQFDYAICNVTLQMVAYPEVLVKEMKRVAKHLIITFPNFAFYKCRLEMLLKGRMPKKALFGYNWYSTGHIHQLSNADFKELIAELGGLHIDEETTLPHSNALAAALQKTWPNLFNVLSIFRLTVQ